MGELYERNGHTYVRLTKLEIEPKVGDMRIYANGLVPDPALSKYTDLQRLMVYVFKTELSVYFTDDVILDFINQYWHQLYTAMLPETLAIWEPIMLKLGNDFFAALPFDLLITKE